MGYIRRIWLSFCVGVLWSSILQFGWIIIYNCCLILSWWMAWSHNISAWQCILGCKCSICWIHGRHWTRPPLWGPRSYMTCCSCKSSVAICNMSKWHCVTCFHSRRTIIDYWYLLWCVYLFWLWPYVSSPLLQLHQNITQLNRPFRLLKETYKPQIMLRYIIRLFHPPPAHQI